MPSNLTNPASARRGNVKRRRCQAGMSLLETTVALGVTGILIAASGNIILYGVKSRAGANQQTSVEFNARAAADMIADDMKGAVAYNSMVTINGQQKSLPTQTVVNAGNGNTAEASQSNEDDYTHPLTFDIYNDAGGLRRVRYWRRYDSTLQCYVIRREVVNDSMVGGVRTAAESATGADAGRIVARNVERFTAFKPYDTTANASSTTRFDTVRITVQMMEGMPSDITAARSTRDYTDVSRATAQTDIMLRNNALQ